MRASKRARYTYGPRLERKGPQLFQMVDKIYSACFIADYADALTEAGAWIFDNTAILGLLRSGVLLRNDSRLYLVFASPSDFSATQVKTALKTYHDTYTTEYITDFINSFDMVIEAEKFTHYPSPTPRTHACLELDFSTIEGLYPETDGAVKETVNSVIHAAIRTFINRYGVEFPLPSLESTSDAPDLLLRFFEWLSKNKVGSALFVTVCHIDKIIGRFLHAAMWERFIGTTLTERMSTLRGLVLVPLWRHLASPTGVVRKLLVVGSYMLRPLLEPSPSDGDLEGLPTLWDISPHSALHGFTSSQIRTVFRLDDVSPKVMDKILAHCNLVFAGDSEDTEPRYSPESVLSVFDTPDFDRFWSGAPLIKERLYAAYLSRDRKEAAARALYPLLRTNSNFRNAVAGLLAKNKAHDMACYPGPIFSLGNLVTPRTKENMFARAVMMGLMVPAKVGPDKAAKSYVLAGGCAHALLKHAFDECNHPQSRLNVQAVSATSLTESFTEQEIANLVLEHYRDVPASELPNNEAQFQADFAKILRAVLQKHYAKSGFPSDVQIEVWLRKNKNDKDNGHRRCDVILRVRCNGQDWFYIFELKYFNPTKTMKATHSYLDELNKKLAPNGGMVLLSQSSTPTAKLGVFCDEVASMRNVPEHWYVATGPPRIQLRFAFMPCHIRAFYNYTSGKPETNDKTAHGQVTRRAAQLKKPPPPTAQTKKPAADSEKKTQKIKTAVSEVEKAGGQAMLYCGAASSGVVDQYGEGKGISDARFTHLGVGKTVIVPFTVVNVAGRLVYVEKHKSKDIDHRIAIVDAYPWTADPSERETDKIHELKKSLP